MQGAIGGWLAVQQEYRPLGRRSGAGGKTSDVWVMEWGGGVGCKESGPRGPGEGLYSRMEGELYMYSGEV